MMYERKLAVGPILGGRRKSDRNRSVRSRDFRRPAPPSGRILEELRLFSIRFSRRMKETLSSHTRAPTGGEARDVEVLSFGAAVTELSEDGWFIPLRANTGERAVLVLDDELQRFLIGFLLGWKKREPEEGEEPSEEEREEDRPPSPIGEISRSALRPFVAGLLRRVNQLMRGRRTGKGPDLAYSIDLERLNQAPTRLMRGTDNVVLLATDLRDGEEGGMLALVVQHASVMSLLTPDEGDAQPGRPEEVDRRLEKFVRSMKMTVSARLGQAIVDLGEFSSLSPGDVLVLDRRIGEPLEVMIGEKTEFMCSPGRSRTRLAIRITERTEVKESI
ncbi:MAG: FliM/FliN family flagellar motor switch protein [Planctomycetota bacterium]